ncbi:hypothetical protein PCANC_19375 [Puccinia coronata f. sp. avenae]|uniref:Uncharacterized protein n=1 Tax=Puccinia coronata f. sp. avenae TaxID=200324 RepID=A0A2N5UPF1_9BASI|nr:hypothetical protein PCANC_19375 [Puccinia coronata f. sp. avenae]
MEGRTAYLRAGKNPFSKVPISLSYGHIDPSVDQNSLTLLQPPLDSPSPKKHGKARGRSKSAGTLDYRGSGRRDSSRVRLPSMEEVNEEGHEVLGVESLIRPPANHKLLDLLVPDVPASKTPPPLHPTNEAKDGASEVDPAPQPSQHVRPIHDVKLHDGLGESGLSTLTAQRAHPIAKEDHARAGANNPDTQGVRQASKTMPTAMLHQRISMPRIGHQTSIDFQPKDRPLLSSPSEHADDKTTAEHQLESKMPQKSGLHSSPAEEGDHSERPLPPLPLEHTGDNTIAEHQPESKIPQKSDLHDSPSEKSDHSPTDSAADSSNTSPITTEGSNGHLRPKDRLIIDIPKKVLTPSWSFDSDSDLKLHNGLESMSPQTPVSPDSFEFENETEKPEISSIPSAFDILERLGHDLPTVEPTRSQIEHNILLDDGKTSLSPHSYPEPIKESIHVNPDQDAREEQYTHARQVPLERLESEFTSTKGQNLDMKRRRRMKRLIFYFNQIKIKKRWPSFLSLSGKLKGRKSQSPARREPPDPLRGKHPDPSQGELPDLTEQEDISFWNAPPLSYSEAVHALENNRIPKEKMREIMQREPSHPGNSESFTPPLRLLGPPPLLNGLKGMKLRKVPVPTREIKFYGKNRRPIVKTRPMYFRAYRASRSFYHQTQETFSRIPQRFRSFIRQLTSAINHSKRILSKIYQLFKNPLPTPPSTVQK